MIRLSFGDVSLLIALTFILLLITAELLSSRYGKISIRIDRKRLRTATLVFAILFLATIVTRVIDLIIIT